MAKTKTVRETTKTVRETRNDLTVQKIDLINATVRKVYFSNDNVTRGSLDILSESPNGKDIHTFVPFVWFKPKVELKEGDAVSVRGEFFTDSYEDKNKQRHYSLGLRVDSLEVL